MYFIKNIKELCIIKINDNVCVEYDKDIFDKKNLNNIKKIIKYYNKFFDEDLNCDIIVTSMPFEAISLQNKIILNDDFYLRPYTYIYKYIPHEIIHQCNGNIIKYKDPGKEWLQESLTEYLQLLILKDVLGNKFYYSQIEEYNKLNTIDISSPITLFNLKKELNIDVFTPLIYGRGVLLFRKIFNDDISNLIELFKNLKKVKYEIDLFIFIDVLKDIIDVNLEEIVNNYIYNNEEFCNE